MTFYFHLPEPLDTLSPITDIFVAIIVNTAAWPPPPTTPVPAIPVIGRGQVHRVGLARGQGWRTTI